MSKNGLLLLMILSPIVLLGAKSPILSIDFQKGEIVTNDPQIEVSKEGAVQFTDNRYGESCSAIFFDGSSYLQVKNNQIFNSIKDEFTFTSWVKLGDVDKPWLTLICKGDNPIETPYNPAFRVQVFQYKNNSTVSVNTDVTEYDKTFEKHPLVSGRWFHFVMAVSSKSIKYYIDGREVFSFIGETNFNVNQSDVFIGKDIPGATEFFNGYLDEINLYDYALDEKEVFENYLNPKYVNTDSLPSCSDDINVSVMPKLCGAVVAYELPSSNDQCENLQSTLIKGLSSGSIFPAGETPVIYEIQKGRKRKECEFTVNVNDVESPTVICPADSTYKVKRLVEVVLEDPFIDDNCTVKETKLLYSGTTQSIVFGENVLSHEVIDVWENRGECSYKVIVEKSNEPIYSSTVEVVKPKKSKVRTSVLIRKKDQVSNELNVKNVKVRSEEIVVFVFDDQTEDNDTVNIYINNKLVKESAEILNFDRSDLIFEPKFKGGGCVVEIFAVNQGSIGLNTVKVEIHYKKNIDRGEFKYPILEKTYSVTLGGKTELILTKY